jgi:four helix bundle protein
MRDHTRLRAFELADRLAVQVYRDTRHFPREKLFGLTSQMRRAAVSIPSNIVEGCARSSKADYLHFLTIAYGSAQELQYQVGLAHELGFLDPDRFASLGELSGESATVLSGLIRSLKPHP